MQSCKSSSISPVFYFVYSSIRIFTAFSSIMFVLSSNPSCSNRLSCIRYDTKSYRLLYNNNDNDRNNIIIRIINKCFKKHSFAFYCFHYINHYSYKDMILQYSQRAWYKSQANTRRPTQKIGTRTFPQFHSTFPHPCGKLHKGTWY